MGFRKMCVEGKALTMIKRIKFIENDRSIIGNIPKEINNRSYRFRYLSFWHVSGTANEVVHALATRGHGFETSMYWVEEILIVFEELSGVMDWKKQRTSNLEILEENQSIRRLSLMQVGAFFFSKRR
ncbi:hypothetical protein Godav_027983 [Gossypium davidsonii]|uniref:RNase H type-1 domain-containing protein n=2 Tax=Gossypium TaxID=3633 RepID=A0A7J8RYE9_GOSDV|nr:hypothetical protein [Gossypium davidsonii]MBA0654055.1 hypothetical protein [Gossypium klotzschianum]